MVFEYVYAKQELHFNEVNKKQLIYEVITRNDGKLYHIYLNNLNSHLACNGQLMAFHLLNISITIISHKTKYV